MNAGTMRTQLLMDAPDEMLSFFAQPEVAAVLKLAQRRHFRKDLGWVSERLLWDADAEFLTAILSELDRVGLLDQAGTGGAHSEALERGLESALGEAQVRACMLDGDSSNDHVDAHVRHLRLLAGLSPETSVFHWRTAFDLSPVFIARFGADLAERFRRELRAVNANVHGRLLHVHACALPNVDQADGGSRQDMADALEAGVGRRGFGDVRFFQLFSAADLTKIGHDLVDAFSWTRRYLCERQHEGSRRYAFSFSAAYVST